MPAVVEDALGGITPYGTRRVWMKGCDVLKFFSRCRILSHVMTGISVVMGMLILFELLPLHDYDDRALLFSDGAHPSVCPVRFFRDPAQMPDPGRAGGFGSRHAVSCRGRHHRR